MDKRDRELLDKQLWTVADPAPRSGIIIGFVIVFLIGIGVGDIFSKTRHANPAVGNASFASLNNFGKE